jgi:THAP4-like, heme-binding beta-barrel domain
MSPGPPLHPFCEPLAGLVGTWRGRGKGDYPTIEPFAYTEEVVFGHVGKPFLAYTQRTRDADTGLPLHAEAGYLRAFEDDAVELVVAQPSGIAEILVGTRQPAAAGGMLIDLRSDTVARTPTAKVATEVRRAFELGGDVLTYRLAMAAVGRSLQDHLAAELHRAEP